MGALLAERQRRSGRGVSVPVRRAEWLAGVSDSLHGSKRAKRRLMIELRGHLEDLVAAEVAAGASPDEAESAAIDRLGPGSGVVEQWNAHAARRCRIGRARALAIGIAVAAV